MTPVCRRGRGDAAARWPPRRRSPLLISDARITIHGGVRDPRRTPPAPRRAVNGLGGVPMNSLYAVAKSGVMALTKSAALEYAQRGIRVNALVAGGFRTPMLLGTFEHAAPGDPQSVEAMFAGAVPLGRIGDPSEAAAAIVWLASDAASYVVGHSLIADGGLTAPYR